MLNNIYYVMCWVVLEVGLYVVCEKLLCFSSEEVDELVVFSQWWCKIIGVIYGYVGYQLILQVWQMIVDGLLGDICIVNMQFVYGFYVQLVEQENVSICWWVDFCFVGFSYVLGDLVIYLLFLVEIMVLQLKIIWLMCVR